MDRRSGLLRWLALLQMLLGAPVLAGQSVFWLQTEADTSGFGSVQNPQLVVQAGKTVPLYLWLDPEGVSHGFDGISLDVKLLSSDGGTAAVTLAFDEPDGRWHGTSGGKVRTDSGGTGVDSCNAVDLSNATTIPAEPFRLATLQVTGVTAGSIKLHVCIGAMGIADGGQNVVVQIGLGNATTTPDPQLINGGVPGLCSTVPEATITVTTPSLGDFDGDEDVDQADFGHLQECLLGTTMQTAPQCADTLLNGDPFVDEADVLLFLECFSGPGLRPPEACR